MKDLLENLLICTLVFSRYRVAIPRIRPLTPPLGTAFPDTKLLHVTASRGSVMTLDTGSVELVPQAISRDSPATSGRGPCRA